MMNKVGGVAVRRLPIGIASAWLNVLQGFVLIACIWFFLGPQLESSFKAAERYRGVQASDWYATDTWVKSAECARKTGVWLVICEQEKLIPISDRALADDPGHALILAWWARVADHTITLVDVAHLNLTINLVGLLMLTGTLLCLRSFVPPLVLLTLGPYVFLEWFGTSPHWALIGLTAMQPILPLGLIARWRGWVSSRTSFCMISIGLLALAFASLIREAIAQMTLVVTIGTLVWIVIASWRSDRRWATLLFVALASLLASQTARITVGIRDRIFEVEPAELVATHGMAHTLYIGLGAVENKFGLKYDDPVGKAAAAKVAPDIKYLSPGYFRIMWGLYFEKWKEDPDEVVRIYYEKLRFLLTDDILATLPPPWIFFPLVLVVHWFANGRAVSCGSPACDRRLAINLVSLAFVALFIAQGFLAHPSRFYSSPVGAFMLVMLGVAMENLTQWVWQAGAARFVGALK